MLTRIDIQGLAIIDALSIEFSSGLNVITGETGAGKSILIKALGLLLGAKAEAVVVRHGRESGSVAGVFELAGDHRAVAVLSRYGIPLELDGSGFVVVVRRTITAKGRSLAWINDVPVTMGTLKDFAASMIDVFAQHENQKLLDPALHVSYLDLFLPDRTPLLVYQAAFADVSASLQSLVAVNDDFRDKRRDADYIAFRSSELNKFDPSRADYDDVANLCQRATNQLVMARSYERAQSLLDQGGGGEPLSAVLWEAARELGRIEQAAPEARPLADECSQLASRLDDLSYALGRATSGLELEESAIEAAQLRLAGYQDLFRRLAVADIDGLLAEHERLGAELRFLESAAAEVQAHLDELQRQITLLQQAAKVLSQARRAARQCVKRRVETELAELAMAGSRLEVEFSPVARSLPSLDLTVFGPLAEKTWADLAASLSGLADLGGERAQFLLSTNPGEPPLPLHKVASGGEVSRLMLALKKGLAAGADTCILVFDEIDTGISGRVADVVGHKLQNLSTQFQVICISHLAQVAAYADAHFRVAKVGKDQRTESSIARLSRAESEEELARLLSGANVTASSLANARQLLATARARAAKDVLAAAAGSSPPTRKGAAAASSKAAPRRRPSVRAVREARGKR